jgi:predicted negative regulator of RcsB-dependent stress response
MANKRQAHDRAASSEDRVMDAVVATAGWADAHRRFVIGAIVALVLVGMGAWYYVDYRSQLAERAGTELERLRLEGGSMPAATLREQLANFVSRFGGTPYGPEARVLLAQMQMDADSAEAAIRTLTPVADMSQGSPVAYRAAFMIAAAQEELGRFDDAAQWYDRIASEARFDFLRQEAQSQEARVLEQTGQLQDARNLLATLVEETSQGEGTSPYAERLGEVEAMMASGQAPRPLPAEVMEAPETPSASGGSPEVGAPAADTTQVGGS